MTDQSEIDGNPWYPIGVRQLYDCPEVGAVIAYGHAAWKVVGVEPLDKEQWTDSERLYAKGGKRMPMAVQLRPMRLVDHPDPVKAASEDVHFGSLRVHPWRVYPDPEHYPVCACCSEPMPCRAEVGRKMAQAAVKDMSRFETAGVCPACAEVVTARQKSLTFAENLHLIGGPPVTFHTRGGCHHDAMTYEKQWVAADPDRRRTTLSCSGHVTNHNNGTYDCTAMQDCPGPATHHRSFSTCQCLDCHARPWDWGSGCRPHPKATLNIGNTPEREAS